MEEGAPEAEPGAPEAEPGAPEAEMKQVTFD